jgi:hypothetical protein
VRWRYALLLIVFVALAYLSGSHWPDILFEKYIGPVPGEMR